MLGTGTEGCFTESKNWNTEMVPGSEAWSTGRASELEKKLFLVHQCSVLAGGVPVKVELLEKLGPVSVVMSGTTDLRQNLVHC